MNKIIKDNQNICLQDLFDDSHRELIRGVAKTAPNRSLHRERVTLIETFGPLKMSEMRPLQSINEIQKAKIETKTLPSPVRSTILVGKTWSSKTKF